MDAKTTEKEAAVALRRRGFSYSQILGVIPVEKSTLSLWLREVGISKRQQQKITTRRLAAAHRGGEIRKQDRVRRQTDIYRQAEQEIGTVSKRELWLMCILLHWAEGSKEKESRPGVRLQFSNSDPAMLKLFLKWLFVVFNLTTDDIRFEIFLHDSCRERARAILCFWLEELNLRRTNLAGIYFKRHNPKTARQNAGKSYYGQVRIVVPKSSQLNRRIWGWILGAQKNCRVV